MDALYPTHYPSEQVGRLDAYIDLGLFLNGLPVATAELKTDFTQSINDAVDQYRFDRNPKPKGQAALDLSPTGRWYRYPSLRPSKSVRHRSAE